MAQFIEDFPGVIAAWVFGSAQGGEIREGSDLDLAVLFREIPSLDERADLRAGLQERLRMDEIDLLVLNGASPIARFEAISGRAIYCRDLAARAIPVTDDTAHRFLHWLRRLRHTSNWPMRRRVREWVLCNDKNTMLFCRRNPCNLRKRLLRI